METGPTLDQGNPARHTEMTVRSTVKNSKDNPSDFSMQQRPSKRDDAIDSRDNGPSHSRFRSPLIPGSDAHKLADRLAVSTSPFIQQLVECPLTLLVEICKFFAAYVGMSVQRNVVDYGKLFSISKPIESGRFRTHHG